VVGASGTVDPASYLGKSSPRVRVALCGDIGAPALRVGSKTAFCLQIGLISGVNGFVHPTRRVRRALRFIHLHPGVPPSPGWLRGYPFSLGVDAASVHAMCTSSNATRDGRDERRVGAHARSARSTLVDPLKGVKTPIPRWI
jgi:hypothetical protein